MSYDELIALPVTVDLATAGRAYGFGRTKAYELARRGEFPVPLLRMANRYIVKRSDLLAALGVRDEPPRLTDRIEPCETGDACCGTCGRPLEPAPGGVR